MRLFIAEKPELARDIVAGLGGGSKRDGYYECGNDCVTWCFGHMLQLWEPNEYDSKLEKWNMDDLPFSFVPWKKRPSPKGKDQLDKIIELLKRSDEVVHAGDPDPEGQLLIDEILDFAKYTKPVKRVLINANSVASVQKALAALRDNKEFAGQSAAAEARQVADQVYGFNLTRLYTLAARRVGIKDVLSVGRVQTPILGMVVRRCEENAGHKKSYFYTITGTFQVDGQEISATYRAADGDPVDDKGRITSKEFAEQVAADAAGQPATVGEANTVIKESPPPLPFNLIKLQAKASTLYQMKPDKVKDVTQALREKHKLITYNRSDCQYLPDDYHDDAPGVLKAIAATNPELAEDIGKTDSTIKSRAFNSAKVSAHHAIIPTETVANFASLSPEEQKIYTLIARAYVSQFFPNCVFERTSVTITAGGRNFATVSSFILDPGWKSFLGNEDTGEEDDGDARKTSLKDLQAGSTGTCAAVDPARKETKPKPLYTLASLLIDLTRVAEYVEDKDLRRLLVEKDKEKAGEHGGIGTSATRDTIIKTLFERGFIAEQKKGKTVNIVATDKGRDFYAVLPRQAKFPDTTALWHQQQIEIEHGKMAIQDFIAGVVTFIGREVERVKRDGLGIKVDGPECPSCTKPLVRIPGKKNGSFFWGCSGYPECSERFPDVDGKPGERNTPPADGPAVDCPTCGKRMVLRKNEKGAFFGCTGYPECKKTLQAKDGQPVFDHQKPIISEAHKCTECGKGLVRRQNRNSEGYWWGCSGFPACKKTYKDEDGKPIYDSSSKTKGKA